MDLDLGGKVAVVTAASEGLGFACAARLAREGCHLAICGRRAEPLAAARLRIDAAGAGTVLASQADLSSAEDVARFAAEVADAFGHVDILVINSGHIAYGSLEDLAEEQWYDAFELLLMSAVRLTRGMLPFLRKAGQADIVFLSSATIKDPPPHLLLSTVMRLGVAGVAKSLSQALAGDNIRVNIVAPGYFDTGRVRARIDAIAHEKGLTRAEATAEVVGEMPLGRIGSAEEMADLVAFVVSRRAAYMTGATLTIDGGKGRTIL